MSCCCGFNSQLIERRESTKYCVAAKINNRILIEKRGNTCQPGISNTITSAYEKEQEWSAASPNPYSETSVIIDFATF